MLQISNKTFLGLDFSTQQLKAVLTNNVLEVIGVYSVNFDADLPEFRTKDGVHKHEDRVTVTAPPLMWISALDLLLTRMKQDGVEFSLVSALSGAGQHGSVYWKHGARDKLKNLNPNENLKDQLKDCFATDESPVWMDSSTAVQCRQLEEAVGGPMELCKLTGSRAYHRFTGNQIAKIYQINNSAYKNTERISLVSSFACSLFLGDYASIDYADGSGMNLFNLNSKSLESRLLQCCGDNLAEKLADLVPSKTNLGPIAKYFVEKYKFSSDCAIVAFTGDNPASIAGLNLQPNGIAISLGTSDTVMVWLESWTPSLNAHVLCNPLDKNSFMGLLCFKNGSLTRERIREACRCKNWDEFNSLLSTTKPGNDGNIGFYFDFHEILPNVDAGDRRFNKCGNKVDSFEPAVEARAVIEHQCLAKRLHTKFISSMEIEKVFVTGGASNNQAILQIIADVFSCSIYVQDVSHSAALGCAFRAKHATYPTDVPFAEICKNVAQFNLVAQPNPTSSKVYEQMLERYKILENEILQENKN